MDKPVHVKPKVRGSCLSLETVKEVGEGRLGGLGWGKQFWLYAL